MYYSVGSYSKELQDSLLKCASVTEGLGRVTSLHIDTNVVQEIKCCSVTKENSQNIPVQHRKTFVEKSPKFWDLDESFRCNYEMLANLYYREDKCISNPSPKLHREKSRIPSRYKSPTAPYRY